MKSMQKTFGHAVVVAPIPIVVEWIVSGRLVTPGCWSAPQ